jgi:hypothetical protein
VTGSSTSAGSLGGGTIGGGTIAGNGSSTGGACWGVGTFVGPGNEADCCTGFANASGYCYDPATTTGGQTTGGLTTGGTGGSGGSTGTCADPNATCSASCYSARGYHCECGQCVLNGGDGPVQVTLDWSQNSPRAREDMDLHVFDPNGCEMYYGHRACGIGSLDLDQNAACSHTDNAGGYGNDVENVIYNTDGGGEAPAGTYRVWIDDWDDECDSTGADPFGWTVTVRSHGQTYTYSGLIPQGSGRGGGQIGDGGVEQLPGLIHVCDFDY